MTPLFNNRDAGLLFSTMINICIPMTWIPAMKARKMENLLHGASDSGSFLAFWR